MSEPTPPPLPPHPRYPTALGPIWMWPDSDLRSAVAGIATTHRAVWSDAIGYYLDELARRDAERLNGLLVKLTKWLALLGVLTLALAALNIVLLVR